MMSQEMTITAGVVVDTNDPQQMGRLKIACPFWGDPASPNEADIEALPWAMYVSPLGGSSNVLGRGTDSITTSGNVSYGMWGIPKIGATVVVSKLDGDSNYRIWLGCVYGQHMSHTLPHGRFIDKEKALASDEAPIEPYNSNSNVAFRGNKSYEWKSRGADYSVAAVDSDVVEAGVTRSNVPDDKDVTLTEADGKSQNVRQGYAVNQATIIPKSKHKFTKGIAYDSQVYSWTTPGFHAISMDDRPENNRMRFRTTTGHQIILDDTNERIYLATNKGNNWLEMDGNGNVDLFSERRISIHAAKEMNFTCDETFRVKAYGIHLHSDTDIRMMSGTSGFHNYTRGEHHQQSEGSTFVKSNQEYHLDSASTMYLEASGDAASAAAASAAADASAAAAQVALIDSEIASLQPTFDQREADRDDKLAIRDAKLIIRDDKLAIRDQKLLDRDAAQLIYDAIITPPGPTPAEDQTLQDAIDAYDLAEAEYQEAESQYQFAQTQYLAAESNFAPIEAQMIAALAAKAAAESAQAAADAAAASTPAGSLTPTINIKAGISINQEAVASIDIMTMGALSYSDPGASLKGGIWSGMNFMAPVLGLVGHTHNHTDTITVQHGNLETIKTSIPGAVGGGFAIPAAPAESADDASANHAFLTARVPQHEPWPRVMMTDAADQDANNTHILQWPTGDEVEIGLDDRGLVTPRGTHWHR